MGTGASKEWDVTLLTTLLLSQPGYCKVQPGYHFPGNEPARSSQLPGIQAFSIQSTGI